MTRRLRIVIGSAVILVGLLVIVILSFVGVTHTGFGRNRVRSMVSTMLAGKVKGKVCIGANQSRIRSARSVRSQNSFQLRGSGAPGGASEAAFQRGVEFQTHFPG